MSYYDSDDARGRSQSPGLTPYKYDFKPQPSPPPEVPHRSPTTSPEAAASSPPNAQKGVRRPSKRRKSAHHHRSRGESILIHYIDPNRPELAHSPGLGSRSTTSSPPPDHHSPPRAMAAETELPPIATIPGYHALGIGIDSQTTEVGNDQIATLPLPGSTVPPSTSPARIRSEAHLSGSRRSSDGADRRSSRSHGRAPERKRPSPPRVATLDVEFRAKRPRDSTLESHIRSTAVPGRPASYESNIPVATSPSLQDCMLDESQVEPGLKLPAMVATSPEDAAAISPPAHLPPVSQLNTESTNPPIRPRTTSSASLGGGHSRSSSRSIPSAPPPYLPFSRPLARPVSVTSPYGDTPTPDGVAGHSPPEASTGLSTSFNHHPRRAPPRSNGPPFLASTFRSSTTSSGEGSVPSLYGSSTNTNTSTSTDGFTPSTTAATPSDRQTSADTPQSASSYTHYPTVQVSGYKCHHEGCTAPPFATQYLLK